MSHVPFWHHPLKARGINASKFGWGHQVWAEGRWHTPAGAEGKGTFHKLFWRLVRRCRALWGRAPVWVRLRLTFPAFLGSSGWCPVVLGQGPGFPGKPILTAEIQPRAHSTGRQGTWNWARPFRCKKFTRKLEMIWEKKIKNPSATHLFLYMVVVAIWGKTILSSDPLPFVESLISWQCCRRWKVSSARAPEITVVQPCLGSFSSESFLRGLFLSTPGERKHTPVRNKVQPRISFGNYKL